ncbi:MAG: spermidine synthase, partial [Kiritimatiellia bacterium]
MVDAPETSADGLDDFSAGLRRERATRALLPLFFVSGATGLAYQTIWARELHLVFGTSTFAIATVLAAFMCGLALGGLLMGRWADRLARPLAVYGWMEVGIGAYALLFPFLLRLLTPIYLSFWEIAEPSPLVFGAVQFLLVGSTLLLPTMMMGATLPLLARFATDRMAAVGDRVGTLYAVNTAGAVFGTWICGFMLLPVMGLWATTITAAVANLVLGVLALVLDKWSTGALTAKVQDDLPAVPFDSRVLPVAIAAGLAGFSALAYEVAWTRILGLMLGASVYGFSIMLLAFLTGIAAGGYIGGRWADRLFVSGGQARLLGAMAAVQIGVGLLSWLLLFLFPELPVMYVLLYGALQAHESQTLVWIVGMALAVLVMTPPAVL